MTTNNVIAVSFEEASAAYQALSKVKELDSSGQISIRGADVVERSQDGQLTIKDHVEDAHVEGTATGGLLGLIVGILGGPFGVLIGGATGLLIGSLFDLDDTADEGSVLAAISNTIRPGQTVLLTIVDEEGDQVLDNAMAGLGGRVLRRGVNDVESEIAAAEEAQRAAQRQARTSLRAERRQQLNGQIHTKVDALMAKL
jgi:uncharacterized membrane protein